MVGRPGVRLPYVRYFGLHYQMLDDRTRFTVRPGLSWRISNADLAAALGSAADVLLTRLSAGLSDLPGAGIRRRVPDPDSSR